MTGKFRLPTIIAMAAACTAASSLYAQQAPARGAGGARGGAQNTTQAIVQVKPGLYMVTGAGANSMVRV